MSTVLLGWELGDGLGHVANLVAVAHELATRGHRPVLAVKDFAVAIPLLRELPFPVLQAPIWLKPGPVSFQAASSTDILAIRGYADADGLLLLLNQWQALIDLTGAELVVCDFAPSLCLAAYGVLPTVLTGAGFTVPPATGDTFPRLGPGQGAGVSSERILEVVRNVQRRRQRPVPESLPAFMAAPGRFVRAIPEVDAYRAIRADLVVEPMRRPCPPLIGAPSGTYFAYLNGNYPGVEWLLPQLAANRLQGSAYIRNAPQSVVNGARQAGVKIYQDPPPLHQVLNGAAAVIHHGGINTAEAALTAGRPQVTLPTHLENTLTAAALKDLGVGVSLSGHNSVQAAVDLVREVTVPGAFSRHAQAFAGIIEARSYQGCLSKIVDCCQTLLS
jgi:rhamnosyltransferase subunit B